MEVLHLNKTDVRGGAARAAYRLHRGLLEQGVLSRMLVDEKEVSDPEISTGQSAFRRSTGKVRSGLDRLPQMLFYDWTGRGFYPGRLGRNIRAEPLVRSADVVHLHWLQGGFVSMDDLKWLSERDASLVWTIHDMWSFTGGCAYSFDCERYQEKCGCCPVLKSSTSRDLSRKNWRKKRLLMERIDVQFVSPSSWLARCADSSSILDGAFVDVIRYGIDLNRFRPEDQMEARAQFELDPERQYILFSSSWGTEDRRKGFQYLKDALSLLAGEHGEREPHLVTIGEKANSSPDAAVPVKQLGYIEDERRLISLYSACDLLVVPSLQDNYPNVVIEALSCGTPCVVFDAGGIPEMIEHKRTGYIAEHRNAQDLAEGISWVLSKSGSDETFRQDTRAFARDHFDRKQNTQAYVDLYRSLGP